MSYRLNRRCNMETKERETVIPSTEWVYSVDFRLVKDANYQKRYDKLIQKLKKIGFVENLTTSSLYFCSLEPYELDNTKIEIYNILRNKKHGNINDIAIIREVAIKNEVDGDKITQYATHKIFILVPEAKDWVRVNEYDLYRILSIYEKEKHK